MESRQLIEIAILAVVAVLVLARLYSVLGQKRGSERPSQPVPRTAPPHMQPVPETAAPRAPLSPQAAEIGGVAAIMQADPGFEPSKFLSGARAAYEMIVQAFAVGDVQQLKSLLAPRVFDVYEKAIADRAASGGKGPELVRLRHAEIVDATFDGEIARVSVRFEAELAEGQHGIRETRERWTFERSVRSRDPNWLLASVAQA
jgi:predicted lipid-binding transport protein (Tim44 family)